MTEIRKAADAAAFLSMVPALVGYVPSESLIAVLFVNNRSAGAMRVDLPRPGEESVFADTIAGYVCRADGVDSVAFIQYADTLDTLAVHDALTAAVDGKCGLPIKDSLYVTSTGYGSHIEGAEPRPIADIHVPEDLQPMVKASSQSEVVFPEPTEGVAQILDSGNPVDDIEDFDLGWFIEEVVTGGFDRHDKATGLAILTLTLNRPALRDIAIVQWVGGEDMGTLALVAQVAWESGIEYPAELAQIMWGEADRPDPKRLEAALNASLSAANSVSLADSVGPLATASWLLWALGRSSAAEALAQKALAIEPDHGLSGIVASFVNAGHLPNWAFTR